MKVRQIADQYLSNVTERGVSAVGVLKISESGTMIVMIVEVRKAAHTISHSRSLSRLSSVFLVLMSLPSFR